MIDDVSCVLDASAFLALLNEEPGAETVEAALNRGAAVSTVNLSEILGKLAESGEDPADILAGLRRQGLVGPGLAIEPLTEEDAVVVAQLREGTKAAGLSLGDRACLALARRLGVPAMTADRAWARLKVGVAVQTIR